MQRHTDIEITEDNIENIANDANLFVEVVRDFDHFMKLLNAFPSHAKLLIKAYYITGIYVKKFLDAETTRETLEEAIDDFADAHSINIDSMFEEEFTPAENKIYTHYAHEADIRRIAFQLDTKEPLTVFTHFSVMEQSSYDICVTHEESSDGKPVEYVDVDLQNKLGRLFHQKFVLNQLTFLTLLTNRKKSFHSQVNSDNIASNLSLCIAAMPMFEDELLKRTVLLLCMMEDENDFGKLKMLINEANKLAKMFGDFYVENFGTQLSEIDNIRTPINHYQNFDFANSSMHGYRKYKSMSTKMKKFMNQLLELRRNALVLGNRFVFGNAYVALHNPSNDIHIKPVIRNDHGMIDLPIDVVKKIVVESRQSSISEAVATQWVHRFFAKKIDRINSLPSRVRAAAMTSVASEEPSTTVEVLVPVNRKLK